MKNCNAIGCPYNADAATGFCLIHWTQLPYWLQQKVQRTWNTRRLVPGAPLGHPVVRAHEDAIFDAVLLLLHADALEAGHGARCAV